MEPPNSVLRLLLLAGWLAGLLSLTALVLIRERGSWVLYGVVVVAWIVALLGAASLLRDGATAERRVDSSSESKASDGSGPRRG